MSKDWGFWYTLTTNLKGIKEIVPEMRELRDSESETIIARVEVLLGHIEARPKTVKWKLRSKIGTRQRWYEPVETTDTVGDFGIWRLRNSSKKPSKHTAREVNH
jgi:hypothetical protein